MTARAAARRAAREAAVSAEELALREDDRPDAALERARVCERLLVVLEEPFRTTVISRYLDGKSAAAIARDLGVPAGTIRWRLKTGLDRLRAALDEREPSRKRAFAPLPPLPLGGRAFSQELL